MSHPLPQPSPSPQPSPAPPPRETQPSPTPTPSPGPQTTSPPPPGLRDEYSGIDPEAMDAFERGLSRTEDAIGRNETRIRHTLQRLDLDTTGLAAYREIRGWIADNRPDLRRRSETIRTQVAHWGPAAALPGGLSAFDENLYGKSSDPHVYAAAATLAEAAEDGEVDAKTLTELEKRADDAAFATALANALGATAFRRLLAHAGANEKDKKARRLQAALGTALAKASARLSAEWRNELTQFPRGVGEAYGVARALRHGTFSSEFLADVSRKIVAWERGRISQPLNYAPVLAVLEALAENPAAAQDFFMGDKSLMKYLLTERHLPDEGKTLGKVLEAATLTFRDREGTPENPSRGFISALLASELVHLEAQRIQEGRPPESLISPASTGRILAGYIADINIAAHQGDANFSVPAVQTASDPHLPDPGAWGAQFKLGDLRLVMQDAFKDSAALTPVLAAQTAFAKKLLDFGASEAAAGRGERLLKGSAEQAGAGFGVITDAAGLAKIESGKEIDEATKRNMKLLLAAVNTGLAIPQAPGAAITAGVVGAWSGVIEDSVKADAESKARIEANSAVAQTETLLRDLAAQAMLKHGLFGSADPPAKGHPWATLEGLRKGDDPLDNPNNFLKGDGRTLMTMDEMIDEKVADNTERNRRVNAYNRWLNSPWGGDLWDEVKDRIVGEFKRRFSEYKEYD